MADLPRVLLVHPDPITSRLIREALEGLAECTVDSASSPVTGFSNALQRDYRLFIFGHQMPVLEGELLYELIHEAYRHDRAGSRPLPAIIYLGEPEATRAQHLRSDVRVKGIIPLPLNLSRLLTAVEGTIVVK